MSRIEPEVGWAYSEVGKFLNMPTHTYLGMTDAKVIDAQCGLESRRAAPVNKDWAEKIGADGFADDAIRAVAVLKELL